jgi:cell division protein FtsZ
MGIGEGQGDGRASQAAEQAISSPLLDDINIKGARGVLVNIMAPSNFGMDELETALSIIQEEAHEDVIFKPGIILDDSLQDTVRITVIATGFEAIGSAAHVPLRQVVNMPLQTRPAQAAMNRPGTTANREIPAHLRMERDVQLPEPKSRHEQLGPVQDEYDEFDVPAWLRKQRD